LDLKNRVHFSYKKNTIHFLRTSRTNVPSQDTHWEGEIADINAGIGIWEEGHGLGSYRILIQPLSNNSPWPDVRIGIIKDNWTMPHLGCFNNRDNHNEYSDMRGVTIYTEEPCDYPILIAETLRFNSLLSAPVPGYVYNITVQLKEGYNTLAWCIHSPLTYREGALSTRFPTLHMPGGEGYTQKTYKLELDPNSSRLTHTRLPVDFPSPYLLGKPSSPLFLSTHFPTGRVPSLVFLSSLAGSESSTILRQMKYQLPWHFQFHNHLLWVQYQSIVNIQPRL
jgi:hypothetical protein